MLVVCPVTSFKGENNVSIMAMFEGNGFYVWWVSLKLGMGELVANVFSSF